MKWEIQLYFESASFIKAALKNSDYEIVPKKVVKLSPAGIKKEGAQFDLPIALGIILRRINSLKDEGNMPLKIIFCRRIILRWRSKRVEWEQ